jgi:hypothetical protein
VPGLRPPPIPANGARALADIQVGGGPGDPAVDTGWGEPGLTPAERVIGWNTLEVLAYGRQPGRSRSTPSRRWRGPRCTCASWSAPTWPHLRQHVQQHLAGPRLRHDIRSAEPEVMHATRLDPDNAWVRLALQSLQAAPGKPAVLLPNLGGSAAQRRVRRHPGPAHGVGAAQLPACQQHAPDEHLLLPVAREALQLMAGLFWDLGEPRMRPSVRTLAAAAALACATAAHAQAPGAVDSLCRSADACLAQMNAQLATPVRGATSALARSQDNFHWFGRMNMASTVMLVEQGIIPAPLAGPIARGVAHAIDQGALPGGKRPTDVLVTEKIITDVAGPDATLIHTGRSRQDMHSTMTMAQLRTELLDFSDALDGLRTQLLKMAGEHAETFVPAYTNGVQAMPISYGHYLLGFADSFARDAERIRQAWPRVNRSALGTAVLANSSWPLNRPRLAELLGFDGLAVNGYDATQISPMDVGLEAVQIAGSAALRVGSLMQDVHIQYHQTRPWLLLAPNRTYTSSAMPQKANPGVIQNTRGLASDVLPDGPLEGQTRKHRRPGPGLDRREDARHHAADPRLQSPTCATPTTSTAAAASTPAPTTRPSTRPRR